MNKINKLTYVDFLDGRKDALIEIKKSSENLKELIRHLHKDDAMRIYNLSSDDFTTLRKGEELKNEKECKTEPENSGIFNY